VRLEATHDHPDSELVEVDLAVTVVIQSLDEVELVVRQRRDTS
jgi:hypothetical protein